MTKIALPSGFALITRKSPHLAERLSTLSWIPELTSSLEMHPVVELKFSAHAII